MWLFSKSKSAPRVLVVEDSRTQAAQLNHILRTTGCDVVHVLTGDEGMRKLATTTVDIVLSDVVMPGMNGYEFCKKLKSDPKTQAVPVVLLTSLTDPLELVSAIQCGADSFLTKPYDQQSLVARINSLLALKKGAGAAESADNEFILMGQPVKLTAAKGQIFTLLFSLFEQYAQGKQQDEARRVEMESRLNAAVRKEALKAKEAEKALYRVASVVGGDVRSAVERALSHARWLEGDLPAETTPFVNRLLDEMELAKRAVERLVAELATVRNGDEGGVAPETPLPRPPAGRGATSPLAR